jgi:hypothetical protein
MAAYWSTLAYQSLFESSRFFCRQEGGARLRLRLLLARIVRLDPNDLAATQTLALLMFNIGMLSEAERDARGDLSDALRLGADWKRPTAILCAPANFSTRRNNFRLEIQASSCNGRPCTDGSRYYDKALAVLEDIEPRREGGGLGPVEWSEKGLLLDRMGRRSEAFAAPRANGRCASSPASAMGRRTPPRFPSARPTSSSPRGSKSCRALASDLTSLSRYSSSVFPVPERRVTFGAQEIFLPTHARTFLQVRVG